MRPRTLPNVWRSTADSPAASVHVRKGAGRPGFLLLEVLLGIAIFAIFLSATGLVLLKGQESTIAGGDRGRAVNLTELAWDAVRSIRDGNFSDVTPGQHGIRLSPTTEKWEFFGTQSTMTGGYTLSVNVTSLASDWLRLAINTKWKRTYSRSGSVTLTTDLTNWQAPLTLGDWSAATLVGTAYTFPVTDPDAEPLARRIVVRGNYAFVSSRANPGLYIFDITDPSGPVRVNSSFSLPNPRSAYDLAMRGSTLYVLTDDPTNDIKYYRAASPTTFSPADPPAGDRLGQYILPGGARGAALGVAGSTLFVAMAHNNGDCGGGPDSCPEFLALDASNSGTLVQVGQLHDDGGNGNDFTDLFLSGTAAYLTSKHDYELFIADVENPNSLSKVASYNFPDIDDGLAVAVAGQAAVLGRARNSSAACNVATGANCEALLVSTQAPGTVVKGLNGSGVLAVDIDGRRCYGFLAMNWDYRQLQIVQLWDNSMTSVYTYPTSYQAGMTGGRGVYYDHVRDRLYVATKNQFMIFKPGVAASPCTTP